MIITSALLAYFDAAEPDHAAVPECMIACRRARRNFCGSADCLVATRVGVDAELAVLRELPAGQESRRNEQAARIVTKYQTADAANAVRGRYRTRTILTLDRRHFGARS